MFAADTSIEDAHRFSRFDEENLLSTVIRPIRLEDEEWKSVEHYVHAKLAGKPHLVEKAKQMATGLDAYKFIKPWYRSKCEDWKDKRRVLMTRAIYTLTQMYPDIAEHVLSTGDEMLVETSMYDHYWGIGRDLRGENMVGKVWMDVRKKLREEAAEQEHEPESL